MCDFKPGDEVVCVDAAACPELIEGAPYIVERVLFPGDLIDCTDGETALVVGRGASVWVFGGHDFREEQDDGSSGYRVSRFRKVQKRKDARNLTEWLSQPSSYDEEQQSPAPRSPAKKREKA